MTQGESPFATDKARYLNMWRLYESTARLDYHLWVFGCQLAKEERFKDIDGLEAIHLYLIHKHRWTPQQVQAMSHDQLRLALHQEMQGWTLPPEAVF